ETPFNHVVRDALTMTKYGFSILEKVYRFRRKKKGSKFNDGKVGIKYLPIRAQRSIRKFIYDEGNRTLLKVEQVPYGVRRVNLSTNPVYMDRDRILLFRVNPKGLSPYGNSPLADA
ncbi:phage portal protein family protein, partial [Escherichia coli]|uniref:phage portal protein family protein n=1 Tax=Escherichia coli TaxID=562 RepID=UPI003F79BC8A